jgi:hypothetical protein
MFTNAKTTSDVPAQAAIIPSSLRARLARISRSARLTVGKHGRLAAAGAASCAVLSVLVAAPANAATANPNPLLNPAYLSLNPQVYGTYGYGVNLDPVTTIKQYYGPSYADNLCQLNIGAQATTNREAVGSIEISCSSAQYVAVDLRLYHYENGSWVWKSSNYAGTWKYVPAQTWMVWDTTPGFCGSGSWQVDAQMAISGHGGNSYYGPTSTASWFVSQTKPFTAC